MDTHIESEPTPRRANQNLQVPPLREVVEEITARSLRRMHAHDNRVWIHDERAAGEEVLHIRSRLLHIPLDIHRETGRFGDRQPEVESDASGDAAETDEQPPHGVNVSEIGNGVFEDRVLESGDDNESDNGGRCNAIRVGHVMPKK